MPDDERVVTAVAALELFQACALIHDDVMDRSDTRRGQPAAHRRFGRAAPGRPAGAATGTASAPARRSCSATCAWPGPTRCSSAAGWRRPRLDRARPLFDEMRTELMAGQYLDLLEQAVGGGSVDRARRVIQLQERQVQRAAPAAARRGAGRRGAAAAGRRTTAYGLPLGEAFQLRDDVLGVFGDPAETGKPAGDDLREGKRTVLVALASQSSSAAQAAAAATGTSATRGWTRPGWPCCGRSSWPPGRWPRSSG